MFDVIVAGAGPAGAVTARDLSQKGYQVLLLEKHQLPRYKPCGGGVSAKTASVLGNGLEDFVEDETREVIFTYRYRYPITLQYEEPLIHMVMRDKLDSWLAAEAQKAGAELVTGTAVKSVIEEEEKVRVQADGREWPARIVVGADGALSAVAKNLALTSFKRTGIAVEAEACVNPDDLQAYRGKVLLNHGCIPQGYDWIFPKKDHLSVGSGTFNLRQRNLKLARYLTRLEEQMGLHVTDQNLHGHPIPVLADHQPVLQTRLGLVVGDAACLIDPFSGEGLYHAVKSAGLAASVIDSHFRKGTDLSLYSELVRQEIVPELMMAGKVAKVVFAFPSLIHRLVTKNPYILRLLMEVVFGKKSYSDLYKYLTDRYSIFRKILF